MRVFVTGASGWIGSALVPELIGAGHEVIGLARSDESAESLLGAGAQVQPGSLEDLDSLRAGADRADGVIHLAFIHDFSQFDASVRTDLQAVETLGATLGGSDRPFLIASGVRAVAPGRPATERDAPDPSFPRTPAAELTVSLAESGVRSAVVRLPPSVHGEGDRGFVPTLIDIARARGVAAYIAEGSNRWPAVHRLDAARLFRLGLEKAPAGSILHAIADEGVPTRTIAEVIGRHLELPVLSISPDEAAAHFGWMGLFFGADSSATSEITRELLDWQPVEPGLVGDLDRGHYFDLRPPTPLMDHEIVIS
ncbi:MAG: SDR family oxidoreductase [Acidimicrobiales bacterium]